MRKICNEKIVSQNPETKALQNTTESMLSWPFIAKHRTYPKMRFVYPGRLHCRKINFLLQSVVGRRQYQGQECRLCLLCLSVLGPHLTQVWEGPINGTMISVTSTVRQFCCIQNYLFPLYLTFSLVLSIFLPPFLKDSLSSEKGNLMMHFHLGLKVPRSLTLCIRVDFCIFPIC